MQFKAEVKVTLKRGVLDPQGAAVQGALKTLGYSDFTGVRVGKLVELWLTAENEAAAREQVEAVSKKLLANPVLEHYTFTLTPVTEGPATQPATPGAGPTPTDKEEMQR